MKIAVFHNIPTGGAKRTVYEEVKYLSRTHDIDLFEYTNTKENVWDLRPFVNKIYRFPFSLGSKLPRFLSRIEKDYKNFILLKKVSKKIARKINKANYDLVLVHPDVFTESPFILRYLKIPHIYYCQEYLRQAYEPELHIVDNISVFKKLYESFMRNIRKNIDKTNISYAKKILVSSQFVKNNIKRVYKKESEVCYLGVDTNVFKKSNSKRKNKLLFIGDRNYIKGYDFAEKIINVVKKKINVNLEILGTTGNMDLRNDNILAQKYSESIATLCVGRKEPLGLSAIESMSCGTPVLAVNEGGYKETVRNGETGYLLKRDPGIFSEKIIYFIKHHNVIEKMGNKGREHVTTNFTWKKHNNILEDEMINLVKGK